MPHVTVQLLEGRTTEQKRNAAKAIAQAMVEHCGASIDGTVVVFQDISRDSWSRAGVLISDRDKQK
jgi:4-oxalocrotonate tautomerase